ncbi:MAG: alpha-galactosidase, partial [Paludibacter sp.]|nr:alpha-galactosidase [Paludibacter sp.]
MRVKLFCIAGLLFGLIFQLQAHKKPIMGWSSWNHFRININEEMIRGQADAMISSGMYKAGYRFV